MENDKEDVTGTHRAPVTFERHGEIIDVSTKDERFGDGNDDVDDDGDGDDDDDDDERRNVGDGDD